jgi:hypothetical protein
MGKMIKQIITKIGAGTRKTNGMNLKINKKTMDKTVIGSVRSAVKNINETYVSG